MKSIEELSMVVIGIPQEFEFIERAVDVLLAHDEVLRSQPTMLWLLNDPSRLEAINRLDVGRTVHS